MLAGPASALELYHEAGIVHRDVKPGNLLFDRQGRLVLTDFDLAKNLDTVLLTEDGRPLGTPAYMSPEQWEGRSREIDGRADIYSLGVVFYEALTLREIGDVLGVTESRVSQLHTKAVLGMRSHLQNAAA